MRYMIDEDLATNIARIARRLGVDAISVHEIGREEWSDEQQLTEAAIEGRCVVTGNRGDFQELTRDFYATGRPHASVLFVQGALRHADPAAVARALLAFDQARGDFPMNYTWDFLQPAE
jgi:predicted nuclease of predicted toxin-antitoxin system